MLYQSLKWLMLLMVPIIISGCGPGPGQVKTHGIVQADFIYISAEESGLIKSMPVQKGEKIQPGAMIAKLENNQIEDAFLASQAELKRQQNILYDLKKPGRQVDVNEIGAQLVKKKSFLHYSQQKYMRIKRLVAKNFASQDELDKAESEVNGAISEVNITRSMLARVKMGARIDQVNAQEHLVKRMEYDLKGSQSRFNKLSVITTQSGLLFDIFHHEGEYVNQGDVLASLIKKDKLKVVFYLSRENLDRINVGSAIEVSCYTCKAGELAKITYIDNEAEFNPTANYDEENSAKMVYRAEAEFMQATDLLKPGQPVRIEWTT